MQPPVQPGVRAPSRRLFPAFTQTGSAGATAAWLPWTVATAVAGLHGIVAFVLLDPQTLLSLDAAVKLLQSKTLVASGWTSLALPYPGAVLDPGHRFFPYLAPFAFRTSAEWHGIFPTAVALLNATVVSFGTAGVVFLSVMSSALTMGAAAYLSTGPSRSMIPALLGLCTCFWFYAVLPWEHVPAAALSTSAFAVALRGRTLGSIVLAGFMLGCGATLRDESLLLLPGLLWAHGKRGASFSAIGLVLGACALPIIAVSGIDPIYGRPAAAHLRHAVDPFQWVGLASAVELPHIGQMPPGERYNTVVHGWLLGYTGATQSLSLVGILIAIALAPSQHVRTLSVLVVLSVVLALHLRDLYVLVQRPDFVSGLLRLSPFLIFAVLPAASPPRIPSHRRTLLWTVGTFLAGMLLMVNTTGGASLGPRLLIPVLPLMLVASWDAFQSYWRVRRQQLELRLVCAIGVALLAGSLVMQAGVAARGYVAFNASERQAVRWLQESTDPIVVDSTFTASVAEPVYTRRLVFLAQDQHQASELAGVLAARRFQSVILVSREEEQRLNLAPFRLASTRRTMRTVVQHWVR